MERGAFKVQTYDCETASVDVGTNGDFPSMTWIAQEIMAEIDKWDCDKRCFCQ